jgi:hypothetical protein
VTRLLLESRDARIGGERLCEALKLLPRFIQTWRWSI